MFSNLEYGPSMKEITPAQFEAEVLRSTVPVVVDFFTNECQPCRQVSLLLSELEGASEGALKVVKVDASADGQFSASFQVTVVPTLVLFRNGQQIAQVVGAKSKKGRVLGGWEPTE